MRRLLVLAAVMALAVARPELYREKEDFQYSRSSSDEGTKAGYYGAQRGNMGGNYERAHNMDTLAQHQMGGLIKTVHGELGDGANQRSGSVFTAANSRGMYGSGHYDLSNLEGRNFQEGTTFDDSQSQSYIASHNTGYRAHSSANRAGYDSNLQSSHAQGSSYSGYNAVDNADQLHDNNMQALQSLQGTKQYHGHSAAESSGYSSQSGYRDSSSYDQVAAGSRSSNSHGSQIRLVGASQPARIYIRPGGTVTVPVSAQSYDNSQGYSSSSIDHNAINTESDDLSSSDRVRQTVYPSTSNPKKYESSYKYRKEWERHSTNPAGAVPLAVPTFSPYASHSELDNTQTRGYEQQLASGLEAQNAHSHSSHQYSGYDANSASSSHQAAYNSEHQSSASGSAAESRAGSSNAYTHGSSSNYNGVSGSLNNQVENIDSKPKSYQSSYSYHKSWERQGDPYIIQPSTNGQYTMVDAKRSQRLTSAASNQGYSGYGSNQYQHYGHNTHSSNFDEDCDENGHRRVARSYNSRNQESQDMYEGQQTQQFENIGQQSQNMEDFGQRSQKLEDFGQQSQNFEDFGQQSQNVGDLGQQSQTLEDFGQQSQKLEDFGQQSQNSFSEQSEKTENFGQQSQNLEDFGQQTQDVGQVTDSRWDNLSQQSENLGQQTQNQWDQLSQTDHGQQTQNTWSTLDTIQNGNYAFNYGRHKIDTNEPVLITAVEMDSHPISGNNKPNVQILLHNTDNSDTLIQPVFTGQETESSSDGFYMTQQSSDKFNPWESLNHQHFSHSFYGDSQYNQQGQAGHQGILYAMNNNNENSNSHQHSISSNSNTNTYHSYHHSELGNSESNSHTYTENAHKPIAGNSPLSSLWDKLDNIERETLSKAETNTSNEDIKYNNQTVSVTQTQTQNNSLHDINSEDSINNITDKKDKTANDIPNLFPQAAERGDIQPENKLKPQEDAGRGDIGPDDEESQYSPSKPLEIIERKPVTTTLKPLKAADITETVSVSKETRPVSVHRVDEQNTMAESDSFSVLSLYEQKEQERKDKLPHASIGITSTSPKPRESLKPNYPEDVQEHNINNEYIDLGQKSESFDQQSFNQFNEFQQHSVDHHGFDFGQQSVNTEQKNEEQKVFDFGQQSTNTEQHNENQKTFDFGQHSVSTAQQNEDQKLFDFGQQSMNTDQQNEDQKTFDFGQHSMNAEQQNKDQKMFDFGQQSINTDQQNEDHQIFDFGQQTINTGQQNVNDKVVDFDQHNVNKGVDFGQQTINTGQQNINDKVVDFGQHNVNEGVDFGQQQQSQQESLAEFVQQEVHMEQSQRETQLQNSGQFNKNNEMEDLNQQIQMANPDIPEETQVEVFTPLSSHNKEEKENKQLQQPIEEREDQTHKVASIDTPPEPTTSTTEKPGFWRRTKDKVASWFSRS